MHETVLATLERWSIVLEGAFTESEQAYAGLGAVGCGDGDGDGMPDDGGDAPMDASMDGGRTDGGRDSGNDSGSKTDLPTIWCGANTCEGNIIQNRVVNPCCVPDGTGAKTDTCGFEADDIKAANPASPFSGCVPRDVPAASASTYCGEFWDQVEMEKQDNGGLDIRSGSVRFTFEGCCLPTGECGAQNRHPARPGRLRSTPTSAASASRA